MVQYYKIDIEFMTKRLTILLFALTTALVSNAQRIKGSDTVLPVSQKEAEVFMQKYPKETVTITGGGSGVGISSLLEGTTDIAQSSRKIKFDEKAKLKANGKDAVELIVAYDALAVIVHPSNPIDRLTREQLDRIFTGKITNWKEVGGPDLKIITYARETSSGTYEFFKESVLKHKNYKSGIMSMPATGSVIQSISQTKGAIGYVGLAYLNPKVKALDISYDQGENYHSPELSTTSDYPIVRPLYFYYVQQDFKNIEKFINFITSKEGQEIILSIGFIPNKEFLAKP